ncbi:MAG: T9SS type A sorting domain-containing protein, partial [Candidatus Marinimicrobia bacterium]|nr:T9SS type A sorting domain-containing protein [Candidatus Neomarinimicrobiota bacterium]
NEGLVVATISDDNLNDESGELILTVQPDQVGTATLSVMVSDAGGLSDTTQFTLTVDPQSDAPATFDLITPPMEANVDSQQPTFTWHPASDPDVGDVLAYTLYLGTDIENYSEVYAGTDTSWTPTELLVDNSTYYWLVTVTDLAGNTTENSDGVWHFYVNTVNDPPEPVVLVTPTANSVEVTLTPEFYWEVGVDPDPGDSLFYELWIDTTSYFTNSMTIETSEHQLTLETPLMDNSEYFWKVIIADASGATVESDTMRFWTNTELEPPNPFDLVSPADLTQGLTTTPEFIWQVATDNDPQDYAVYMLVIAADSEFVSILQTIETLVDTEYTLESALTNDTQYWWKVIAMDTDSLTTESPVQSFTVGYVTTEPEAAIPTKFALHTNYPNPFNPTTTIRYDLPERSTVSLVIYNQLGQPIRTLVNSEQLAGFQSVMWDGRNNVGQQVGTGIYFYQINAGKFNQTRKMILLK